MADEKYIYEYCHHCGGDGKETHKLPDGSSEEITCHQCEGVGKTIWGELHNNKL